LLKDKFIWVFAVLFMTANYGNSQIDDLMLRKEFYFIGKSLAILFVVIHLFLAERTSLTLFLLIFMISHLYNEVYNFGGYTSTDFCITSSWFILLPFEKDLNFIIRRIFIKLRNGFR